MAEEYQTPETVKKISEQYVVRKAARSKVGRKATAVAAKGLRKYGGRLGAKAAKKLVGAVTKAASGALTGGASLAASMAWDAKNQIGQVVGGLGALAMAVPAMMAASVGSSWSTFGITLIAVPVTLGFFLVIINTGAYIVPPSTEDINLIFEPVEDEDCPQGWPVDGSWWIVQGPSGTFSHDNNDAIDIAADLGTPIKATHPGRVFVKPYVSSGYGYYVHIESTCNGVTYFSRYAHMSVITIRNGAAVSAGQVIGLVGNSGRSKGPHVHYEFRIGTGNSTDATSSRAGPASSNPPYMARPYIPIYVRYGCTNSLVNLCNVKTN